MMTELDTLIPQPRNLTVAGTPLEITPVVIGEIPKLLKAIRPFAGELTDDPDWVALLSEHGDAVLDALAVCTRKPRVWVDTLALDDAIRVFEAVFEANADFFVARVAPAIAKAGSLIERKVAGATPTGLTPSPASSAPGTATQTS